MDVSFACKLIDEICVICGEFKYTNYDQTDVPSASVLQAIVFLRCLVVHLFCGLLPAISVQKGKRIQERPSQHAATKL